MKIIKCPLSACSSPKYFANAAVVGKAHTIGRLHSLVYTPNYDVRYEIVKMCLIFI